MNRKIEGSLWKALACLSFALINGLITQLTRQLPFTQVAFFEHLFAFLWLVPFLWRKGWAVFKPRNVALHFWRVAASVAGVLFWYQALAKMPMASAVSLGFLGPVMTSLGAVVFLKETMRWPRGLAFFLAFVGVFFMRETLSFHLLPQDIWIFLPMASALAFSFSTLLNKKLTSCEAPLVIVAVLFFWMTLLFGLLGFPSFISFDFTTLGMLLVLGGMTALAHYAVSLSFVCADVTFLLPVGALRFVFTALIGWFFFHQKPGFSVYLGFFVIFSALLILGLFEKAVSLRKK